MGLICIAGTIELAVASVWSYATYRWAFLSTIAVVSYFAKAETAGDINGIFHIDPAALPMTMIAGSVMRFTSYLFFPMVAVFLVALFLAVLLFCGNELKEKSHTEKLSKWMRLGAILLSSSLAALSIYLHLNEQGIRFKLYRIAQATDFVSSFECQGIDSRMYNALFIGPEQRRVLIAPKLLQNFVPGQSTEYMDITQPVEIPARLQELECVPSN
ncbi:hypothetical protein [Bordetella sp.]|uniref:hypothetical protein n=1 Tax=Bordetella sp. TaxID=28081 RepID=UPI003F7CC373